MTTKVGFFHDKNLQYGEIISETDAASKYKVATTQAVQTAEDSSAELVVTDFDTGQSLDATNGMDVQTISSGPLEDKHENYRSPEVMDDFSLGVARVAVKDYAETPSVWKSRNEYWAQDEYDFLAQAAFGVTKDMRYGHSDGEVLYFASIHSLTALSDKYISVRTRNDTTRAWSSGVVASDYEDVSFNTTEDIELSPCFVTVPGLGTLMFYFSLEGGLSTARSDQIIKIFITKDQGASWERYGSIMLNPYFGNVNQTAKYPYAKEGYCQMKATYYNGKIVLGMMLHGTETTGAPANSWEINIARVINLMISDDLGKSWAVVPQEFISSSFYGEPPYGQAGLVGDQGTSRPYEAPLGFGLGYDLHSDKFVLAIRSAGEEELTKDPNSLLRYQQFGRLFFYYNEDDTLFKWDSTAVDTRSYKLADDFTSYVDDYSNYDSDPVDYEVFDFSGATGTSTWLADGGVLKQTGTINGPAYAAGDVHGGTQLVYRRVTDPTVGRTVGIKIDLNAGGGGTSGDFGFGFCRQDENNYYAIGVTATSASDGICQINLKKVVSGVESFMDKTSGGVANSWQKVDLGESVWAELDIVFAGRELISVFFNDTYLFSVEDNEYASGEFFFFTNNHDTVQFDSLGWLTSTIWFNVVGATLEGSPSATYKALGANIDISNDQFGQTWISADSSGIGVDFQASDTLERYRRSNIVLQKFRLDRDVQRVEGKFLAKDKLFPVFGDAENYHEDVGYYLSGTEHGIFPTHAIGMKRAYLSHFTWHKDDPVFFIQTQDDASLEENGVVQRRGYSDLSINPNLGAYWHPFVYGLSPQYCGWELSGGFTYTSGVNDSILQITQDDVGYFEQAYNHSTFGLSTNSEYSIPVRNFDYVHRGAVIYFIMRSPSGNDSGSERTVAEFYMPYMDRAPEPSTPTGIYIRYRVRIKEGTGGATGAIRLEEYVSGTGWILCGSEYGSIDPTVWREFLLIVVPTNLASNTNTEPEISLYFKEQTEESWTAVHERHEPTSSNTGISRAAVTFGNFGSAASTQNRTEWKLAAYSDTCFVDPYVNKVRGETVQSGEATRATKGISLALSGGNTYEGDEWNIVDVSRRAFPKENINERPATVWRSDDDSTDKRIIIDSKQRLHFDTIILYNTNCQSILIEANDTDSWSSPSFSLTLDMTEQDHLEYENYSGRDHVLKLFASFKKDELIGKRFICEDAALGSYRIRSSPDVYLVYETDTTAVIPYSTLRRYLDILSDRIAYRLHTPQQYRYFRITCQPGAFTYPTPEGYFQIGQVYIGMFNQLQWNPEYPEDTPRRRNATTVRNAAGKPLIKRRGRSSTRRELNFVAIDTLDRGFSAQLHSFFEHTRGRRLVYVPDIEELRDGTTGTYTYDLMSCYATGSLPTPSQPGNLTTLKIVLEEDI